MPNLKLDIKKKKKKISVFLPLPQKSTLNRGNAVQMFQARECFIYKYIFHVADGDSALMFLTDYIYYTRAKSRHDH